MTQPGIFQLGGQLLQQLGPGSQDGQPRGLPGIGMHNAAGEGVLLNSFVVRKSEKQHGLQRRIEGPTVKGVRVLAVEDTSTTGASVLTAVDALLADGAVIAGISVIVDRGARATVEERGYEYTAAYSLADLGLE